MLAKSLPPTVVLPKEISIEAGAGAATSEGCTLRLRDGGEGLGDCGRERCRGSADQGRELAAVVEQRPVHRVGIPTGDGFCVTLSDFAAEISRQTGRTVV